MERKPTQFTIRAIAIATFWLGVCFAALGVARSVDVAGSGIAPSVSFVLAVLSLCAAVYALFKNATTMKTSVNVKAATAAIVVWNVTVLPMMLAYPSTLGKLLLVAYEASLGTFKPATEPTPGLRCTWDLSRSPSPQRSLPFGSLTDFRTAQRDGGR